MTETRPTPSADDLFSQAVGSDIDCLTALLKTHGPRVRRRLSINPLWQSSIDAEDVMQVTYTEAFLHIDQLSGRTAEAFVAWLTRIAENNLRDAIKELTRQKRPDPRRRMQRANAEDSYCTLLETVGVSTTTSSRLAGAREAQGLLETAIEQLPETYRKVVRLYDLDGLSVQSVAKTLGRSVGAIYMLRARALERLRNILGSGSKFFTDSA